MKTIGLVFVIVAMFVSACANTNMARVNANRRMVNKWKEQGRIPNDDYQRAMFQLDKDEAEARYLDSVERSRRFERWQDGVTRRMEAYAATQPVTVYHQTVEPRKTPLDEFMENQKKEQERREYLDALRGPRSYDVRQQGNHYRVTPHY